MTAPTDQPSDAPTPGFALGDCVQLVSGGPSMTAEYTRTDGRTGCVWFVGEEAQRDEFPTMGLRRAAATLRVIGRGGSAA